MKKQLLTFLLSLTGLLTLAQATKPMSWYNEPKHWTGNAQKLNVTVDPGTDYWRITHYGFIRDSGPFYFCQASGNFEASVKVTGNYQELFHQAGLMIRIDNKNWIKTGIEYVDGVQNLSAVVTREVSDWSVVQRSDSPKSLWLKLLRKNDFVQIQYSFDNKDFKMLRLAYFPPDVQVQVGMVAAAPGAKNFDVVFEDFVVNQIN
jgi:uncharacterized protein